MIQSNQFYYHENHQKIYFGLQKSIVFGFLKTFYLKMVWNSFNYQGSFITAIQFWFINIPIKLVIDQFLLIWIKNSNGTSKIVRHHSKFWQPNPDINIFNFLHIFLLIFSQTEIHRKKNQRCNKNSVKLLIKGRHLYKCSLQQAKLLD